MTETPSGGGLTPPGPSLEPGGPPVTADPMVPVAPEPSWQTIDSVSLWAFVLAFSGCGGPVGEVGLGVSHYYPRTRVISCVAFDPDGKLDEPVRDLLPGRESAG